MSAVLPNLPIEIYSCCMPLTIPVFIGKYYEKKMFILKHKLGIGFAIEVEIYFSYRIDSFFSIRFFFQFLENKLLELTFQSILSENFLCLYEYILTF